VAAEKILPPLDADGSSAHTPWHRVRGSTGTCRGAASCDLRLALLAGVLKLGPVKTDGSARVVPIPDQLRPVLRAHRQL